MDASADMAGHYMIKHLNGADLWGVVTLQPGGERQASFRILPEGPAIGPSHNLLVCCHAIWTLLWPPPGAE